MVISKKFDYRKRKKRENFFGIPFLPLTIFLILIILFLVFPPIEKQDKLITGRVVDTISLTEKTYKPNKPLEGDLNLEFFLGDLIAQDTNVTFDISSMKCNHFYVCGDGYLVPWQVYNFLSGMCENVTVWVEGPWDECPESYTVYPTQYNNMNCTNIGGSCCDSGEGYGYFYKNLNCGAKECWDECKKTTKKTLLEAIALSSTPWKGNYTCGKFNNMNGSEPGLPFPVWGFGACPQVIPPSRITSYAIQQPSQPITPDLTVIDIYTSPFQPAKQIGQPTERLYAKIKNLGKSIGIGTEAQRRAFTVVGCWYNHSAPEPTLGPIPKNCFFVKRIDSLSYNQELVLDMGGWVVQGKTVQVIVDFYNEIAESREDNNVMIKSFGLPAQCIDPDGLDYYTKGTCTDSTETGIHVVHVDYCSPETENLLIEWYCPPPNGMPQCTATQYICPFACYDGACIEKRLPDLTVINIQRNQFESIEGTKITMKNIGNAPVTDKFFMVSITYVYDSVIWQQEYQIQNPGIMPNATFTLDVRDLDITGIAVNVTAFVDSTNAVEELDETNNILSKWLSPYSCENWNNIYEISLDALDLKAPEYPGTHILNVSLVHSNIILYSYADYFEVTEKEPTHRVCINYGCVKVSGAGSNQCTTDSDCIATCNENWQYREWSECDPVTKKRQRECYDANGCGTIYNKPPYCLLIGDRYYQTEDCCIENWRCDEWSVCYEFEGKNIQSMTCEDINRCNPENYTYLQLRDCCVEEWDCEWGPCIEGKQEKICQDLNNCGTEFTKPAPETRDCRKAEIAWWVWLIIILILVIVILAILIGTKRLPLFKKKPKYPELKEYIKKATERGMSREEIKTKLIETGWPENVVGEALK